MRWTYSEENRDKFGKGVHRDILIVPHATTVTPVAGGPPIITSKVPEFSHGQPVYEGGQLVTQGVDFVITNQDIIKEKFKYTYSMNPDDNISFSCAASAMVQFTIRNQKIYNEETDRWEMVIPNLQYYNYVDEDGNFIIGELEGNYIIKVYIYFDGDSSSMICLGMFRVEEDRAVDNGYNRQITAYDFMQTFREMDIFNWYRHLFEGINKLDNDYLDATNETGEETKKPDNYDQPENWIRKPQKKWTIKAALVDLIDNLAAYDMIVYDENGDALVGCTNTNPSVYGRNYGEGNGYSGFGMPVMLDTDIITEGTKPYTPSDVGPNEYERYGYMDIMDLEFMQNPKVMNDGSLSMGKFLEDIGVLAGRYPFIRADRFDEDVWHDPSQREPQKNRYNNYERCILSFKPLPDARDDETSTGACKLQPDQIFDNHQIVKGFQHEQFTVQDVMQVKIGINDGTTVEFKRLNESQRAALKKGEALQTFTFSNNLFCSYLIDGDEKDDDETKSLVKEYKKIKKALFGKENTKGNMSSKALFNQGYMNIKYRNYVPFKLTTFADPVRDVGDRIRINFQDVVTGESTSFYTFILERTLEGIQKMMDTYSANGQLTNPIFSNYQAGTSYASGNKSKQMMLGYKKVGTGGHNSNSGSVISITPREMVEVMRNIGIRLLDEPITASAKFIQSGNIESNLLFVEANTSAYFYNEQTEEWEHREVWDKEYPCEGDEDSHGLYYVPDLDNISGNYPITGALPYDVFYVSESEFYVYITNANPHIDPNDPPNDSHAYDGEWKEHYINEIIYSTSAFEYNVNYPVVISPANLAPGDTTNKLIVNQQEIDIQIGDCLLFEDYRSEPEDDYFEFLAPGVLANFEVFQYYGYDTQTVYRKAWYISPGIWSLTSAANDPKHRVLLANTNNIYYYYTEDDYIEEYIEDCSACLPRFYIEPTDLKPGDRTDTIYINGVEVHLQYGDCINPQLYDSMPWGVTCHMTNYDTLEKWPKEYMFYVAPGYILPAETINGSGLTPFGGDGLTQNIKKHVELKWEDPDDIEDWEPTPARMWSGTVIVRKEDTPPLHRWDGVEIIDCREKNKYKDTPYIDEDIELNKVYYYGFFPYYPHGHYIDHIIMFYRFTKVIRVDTSVPAGDVPVIISLDVMATSVIVTYTLPKLEENRTWSSGYLWAKKNNYPTGAEDADIVQEINTNETSITIDDLDQNELYYFMIVVTDSEGIERESEPVECITGELQSLKIFSANASQLVAGMYTTNNIAAVIDNVNYTYYMDWLPGGYERFRSIYRLSNDATLQVSFKIKGKYRNNIYSWYLTLYSNTIETSRTTIDINIGTKESSSNYLIRFRERMPNVYGDSSWHYIPIQGDDGEQCITDYINDDNEHSVVIKLNYKKHSTGDYSIDNVEMLIDGQVKKNEQIYSADPLQIVAGNGPIAAGKYNDTMYSLSFRELSFNLTRNQNGYGNDYEYFECLDSISNFEFCVLNDPFTWWYFVGSAPYPINWQNPFNPDKYGTNLYQYYVKARQAYLNSGTYEETIFNDTENGISIICGLYAALFTIKIYSHDRNVLGSSDAYFSLAVSDSTFNTIDGELYLVFLGYEQVKYATYSTAQRGLQIYFFAKLVGQSGLTMQTNRGGDYLYNALFQTKYLTDYITKLEVEVIGIPSDYWDGSETEILYSGQNNKLTVQVTNTNTILFYFYSGSMIIFAFASPVGTAPADVNKINVSFLVDPDKQVAKPSFIYDIGDGTYKYNCENMTLATMQNIYNWLGDNWR